MNISKATLQTLLWRWAELEPERCWLSDCRWWCYCTALSDGTNHHINAAAPEPTQLFWLEFAIREAANARGLRIVLRQLDLVIPLWTGGTGRGVEADTHPAVALLKAYLQTISYAQEAIA